MGHPIVTSLTIAAAVSNGYAQTQSLGAAGALTLNGSLVANGIGVPDVARRVAIHSNSNDSGINWTITGTARPEMQGVAQSETIAGANAGDAVTTQDFATVTSIVGSGATAGTVFAGTNGTASGPWVAWDRYQTNFQVSLAGFVLSGSPIWQVDYTYDDVFGLWLPAGVPFPRALTHSILMSEVGTASSVLRNPPVVASRLTLTAVGGVQLVQMQQGN